MHLHCLALLPLLLLPAPAGAAEMLSGRRHVRADAPMGGDGLSWATAYARFQDALTDASQSQGVVKQIWVAAGTYKPTTNINDPFAEFVLVPGVSIYGGFNGTETLLSQQDPVTNVTVFSSDIAGDDGPNFVNSSENSYTILRAVGNGFTPSVVLDGCTITAAHAPGGSNPLVAGLVLLNAGMTVRNCRFVANWDAGSGAAVTLAYGTNGIAPRFEHCVFEGNYSNSYAGAVSTDISSDDDPLMFVDCDFIGNSTPGIAGAVQADELTEFIRCRFIDNSSSNSDGGALTVWEEGLVQDCTFINNHCGAFGGALYCEANSVAPFGNRVTVVNSLFLGNSSAFDGGAIFIRKSHGDGPTFVNCTVAYNDAARDGGGVHASSIGSTVATNPIFNNSILVANTDQSGSGQAAQFFNFGTFPTFRHCCVQGWTGSLGGIANFGADPDFQDANGADNVLGTIDDDVRLRVGSPCADTGDDDLLPADLADLDSDNNTSEPLPFDLDGGTRKLHGQVDVGAYELGSSPVAFCFGDGTDGACRCANQGAEWHGCGSSLVGTGARLTIAPGVNANTFVAACQGLPGGAFAHYIGATGYLNVPVFAGDGLLCLSGRRHRFGSQSAAGGTTSVTFTWPPSARTQYYQLLYRDPNISFCSGSDINLSNGVALIH